MRVVGGEWRGRRLAAPAGGATRPTSDKVREAIFDMLASLLDRSFDGLEVADLFAGSGALGIEALSRGAARCTFVEHDRAAVAALRANLEALHVHRERARVVARPVSAALAADAREARRYTLLLADPPYAAWPAARAQTWRRRWSRYWRLAGWPSSRRRAAPAFSCRCGCCGSNSTATRRSRSLAGRVTAAAQRTKRLMPSKVTAICPGTFDPVTVGHSTSSGGEPASSRP